MPPTQPVVDHSCRILVVTGEVSGDRYGAELVCAIRRRLPGAEFHGIGGRAMREAGVQLLFDADKIAVTGILEVFGALTSIVAAWRAARNHLLSTQPDLVLLVDYPDFNLRLAGVARRAGLPVAYFVGPTVWAWRKYRLKRIVRDVDRMLVILPFETEVFEQAGVPVQYVGNPLIQLVKPVPDRSEAARALGLDADTPVLGLLPGSRRNEIEILLPILLAAAEQVSRHGQGLQCVLPLAGSLPRALLQPHLEKASIDVHVTEGDFYGAVGACHAALVASGTAALETALMGVPLVATYRVHPWTYRVAHSLSTGLPDVALPNLILGRRAVPELMQLDCRADLLSAAVAPLLEDGEERRSQLAALQELRQLLGEGDVFECAADAIMELLAERRLVTS